jgi:hypothetical protein
MLFFRFSRICFSVAVTLNLDWFILIL